MIRCEGDSCEKQKLRRSPRKAVFLVDGKPNCAACFEAFLETHEVHAHRIRRISENEKDFDIMGKMRKTYAGDHTAPTS